MLDKSDQASLGRKLRAMYDREPAAPLTAEIDALIAQLEAADAENTPAEGVARAVPAPAQVGAEAAQGNVARARALFRWRG